MNDKLIILDQKPIIHRKSLGDYKNENNIMIHSLNYLIKAHWLKSVNGLY